MAIWVLLALIVILLLAWAVLSGFPFSDDESDLARQPRETEVIVEQPSPSEEAGTAVIIEEVGDGAGEEVPLADIPQAAIPRPPDISDTPAVQPVPRTTPAVTPASPRTAGGFSDSRPPEGRLSESEAVATLTRWVARNNHYGVDPSCIRPRSEGFSNRGYTIVLSAEGCSGRSGVLGRWRVDTLDGAVYEQKPDGRYLSP